MSAPGRVLALALSCPSWLCSLPALVVRQVIDLRYNSAVSYLALSSTCLLSEPENSELYYLYSDDDHLPQPMRQIQVSDIIKHPPDHYYHPI